jgi:ABC-type nitrate/sulfonate/bicarbonate transport system ATPase subunit
MERCARVLARPVTANSVDHVGGEAKFAASQLLFPSRQVERDLRRRFADLSSGVRLFIARVMLADPAVLVLDQPTRALDPPYPSDLRRFVRETLAQRNGKTIIVATNLIDETVERGDRHLMPPPARSKGRLMRLSPSLTAELVELRFTTNATGSRYDNRHEHAALLRRHGCSHRTPERTAARRRRARVQVA